MPAYSQEAILYGDPGAAAEAAAITTPGIVQRGMGAVFSYGRRTTQIMALNLAGKGGVPLALGKASLLRANIAWLAKVSGVWMSLEATIVINVVATAAEVAYCSSQQ